MTRTDEQLLATIGDALAAAIIVEIMHRPDEDLIETMERKGAAS